MASHPLKAKPDRPICLVVKWVGKICGRQSKSIWGTGMRDIGRAYQVKACASSQQANSPRGGGGVRSVSLQPTHLLLVAKKGDSACVCRGGGGGESSFTLNNPGVRRDMNRRVCV